MKILKIGLIVVIGLVVLPNVFSQKTRKVRINPYSNFKLNKDKPSVYITFEKYQTFVYERTKESFDMIVLRVHNNTKVEIGFQSVDPSFSPWGKTSLIYRVEKIPDDTKPSSRNNENTPLGVPGLDTFNEIKVKSGAFFEFVVFRSHFEHTKHIGRFQFFLPWEDAFLGNEPEHFVYFDSYDLE